MRFIPDPAVDRDPVSLWCWAMWHFGTWVERQGSRLKYAAMDRCPMCGMYRHGRDHSNCDEIPF